MVSLLSTDAAPSPVPLLTAASIGRPDRAERRGELVRVGRGVYAPRALWQALAPWDRYLARVHAAAIAYPDAVFLLESAAALQGLPVFAEPREVHVALPAPASARAFTGVRIHTRERMPATHEIGGLHIATAAEVAVEFARLRHPAVALAVVGAALRADHTLDLADLGRLSAALPSQRGCRRALWVFDRASATPESPLENVSLAAIEWLGFEVPQLQQWVRGRHPDDADRVDFLWPGRRVAGEADGDLKYSGEFGDARAALRARNARDARLMRHGISATAHWSWPDVSAPRQLREILLAAGIRPTRPEETAPLHTLAAALRSRGF